MRPRRRRAFVAVATGRRVDFVLAGVIAVALLGLGMITLLAQAWLMARPA